MTQTCMGALSQGERYKRPSSGNYYRITRLKTHPLKVSQLKKKKKKNSFNHSTPLVCRNLNRKGVYN